jgi:hypothetical protein
MFENRTLSKILGPEQDETAETDGFGDLNIEKTILKRMSNTYDDKI